MTIKRLLLIYFNFKLIHKCIRFNKPAAIINFTEARHESSAHSPTNGFVCLQWSQSLTSTVQSMLSRVLLPHISRPAEWDDSRVAPQPCSDQWSTWCCCSLYYLFRKVIHHLYMIYSIYGIWCCTYRPQGSGVVFSLGGACLFPHFYDFFLKLGPMFPHFHVLFCNYLVLFVWFTAM